jgi:hypothetical protein
MGSAFSRKKIPLPVRIVFFQKSREIPPGNPEGEQILFNFLSLPTRVPLVIKDNS